MEPVCFVFPSPSPIVTFESGRDAREGWLLRALLFSIRPGRFLLSGGVSCVLVYTFPLLIALPSRPLCSRSTEPFVALVFLAFHTEVPFSCLLDVSLPSGQDGGTMHNSRSP